jgi:hypothetical protein
MKRFDSKERNINPYHHIDPGFINVRKCISTFGSAFTDLYNKYSNKGNDHWARLQNDHLIVDLALKFCLVNNIKSLSDLLIDPKEQELFCSTEKLEGNEEVYSKRRVTNRVLLPYEYDKEIYLEFGTEHFVADTGKSEQSSESKVSIIGEIRKIEDDIIVIYPLIMGAPSFDHPLNKDIGIDLETLVWYGWDWYENFPEDIDEFSQIKEMDDPTSEEWIGYMEKTSEDEIKKHLCRIIGETPRKDWGGEQADIFSTSVHLNGKRILTAFLLKGPAEFREMTPDLLGKRADQIYRLSCTPAGLLIVQHCHSIGEAVIATLRSFAVTPHNPRRYCLINGKDTYKILKAYGQL